MMNQLEVLAHVIRILTFTHETTPVRRHNLYVPDDRPYNPEVETRVRRYYRRGAVR